jgi:hypothetical protein
MEGERGLLSFAYGKPESVERFCLLFLMVSMKTDLGLFNAGISWGPTNAADGTNASIIGIF